MSKRRVIVTGLGAITSLSTLDDFRKGLLWPGDPGSKRYTPSMSKQNACLVLGAYSD